MPSVATDSNIPSLRNRSKAKSSQLKESVTAERAEQIRPFHEENDTSKMKAQAKTVQTEWTPLASRLLTAVCVMTLITRLYKINDPSEVVFDEVHFGGFASNYLRREYFFDVHPPLGKLLIAAVGYFLGYEGNFTFGNIGTSYVGTTAPYVAMRSMMVMFGLMTVSLSFMTMLEMGFSAISSAFAASLLVFGKQKLYFVGSHPLRYGLLYSDKVYSVGQPSDCFYFLFSVLLGPF